MRSSQNSSHQTPRKLIRGSELFGSSSSIYSNDKVELASINRFNSIEREERVSQYAPFIRVDQPHNTVSMGMDNKMDSLDEELIFVTGDIA